LDAFRASQFVELDASFHALRPYAYCVPLAVIANESFPLGAIVGVSESYELYNRFFEAMIRSGLGQEGLTSKPVLSDYHSALVSVCSDRRHFFCFRHLIEKAGSGSFLAQIVRRLAFSSTPGEFMEHIEQTIADIQELVAIGEFQSKQLKLISKTFGLDMSPGCDVHLNPEQRLPQAIWTRAHYGVATCSNHIEGFHRAVNAATKGISLVTRRLSILIDSITARHRSALEFQPHRAREC
jgi:hypothetical protein